MRALYLAGTAYVALSLATLITHEAPVRHYSKGAAWFARVKPRCNALEVAQAFQRDPPPAGWDGAGYAAGCQALAGHLDDARATILALPEDQRGSASGFLFQIGHPVADAGDDVAAGPIMDLVLEFWPENYQALYHAGMSDWALGRPERAKPKLERFRQMYGANDFFGQNADKALARIAEGLGPDVARPGAH
jgi:hypothetical protein